MGAITMEEREAEPYDELKVMKDMISKGKNTIIAHLSHLKDHGQTELLQQGVKYLLDQQDNLDFKVDEILNAVHNGTAKKESPSGGHQHAHAHHPHPLMEEAMGSACGCSSAETKTFNQAPAAPGNSGPIPSALSHWPVQMHLINPRAPHFSKSDFVLAADCSAFTIGGFHPEFLQGKTLGIACPKLDQGTDSYIQKLVSLIDDSQINTMTVIIMEVPCCGGLSQMVQMAINQASRKVPVKQIMISVEGAVLSEQWV
jgi:hypothetical protein